MTITDLVPRRRITSIAVLLGMVAAIAPSVARQSQAAVTGKGYWQESQSETCIGGPNCVLEYSAVPAAKQVTITSVSCSIVVNGAVNLKEIKLGSKNGGVQQGNFTYLTPTKNGTLGVLTFYSINNSSVHILRSGDKANITLVLDVVAVGETVKCTIGGIISS